MQFILKLISRCQNQNRYGAFLLQFPADLNPPMPGRFRSSSTRSGDAARMAAAAFSKSVMPLVRYSRLLQYGFQFFPHHIFIFYHCYMLHIYSSSISQDFTLSPLIFICSESTPLAPVPSVSEDTGCLIVLQMPYRCILPHRAAKS